VNSLPKTVTRQRRDCDLNPGPSAPESSTLTTRLPSHPNCWHNIRSTVGFLSVPSIDSSSGCRRVCCSAPGGQEVSIDRRRASGAPLQWRRSTAHSSECGQCHVDSRVDEAEHSSRVVSASDCVVRGSRFESRRGSCVYHDGRCDIQPWAWATHLYCSA